MIYYPMVSLGQFGGIRPRVLWNRVLLSVGDQRLGEHAECGGVLTLSRSSHNWQVLRCSNCRRSQILPHSLSSLGHLYWYFQSSSAMGSD